MILTKREHCINSIKSITFTMHTRLAHIYIELNKRLVHFWTKTKQHKWIFFLTRRFHMHFHHWLKNTTITLTLVRQVTNTAYTAILNTLQNINSRSRWQKYGRSAWGEMTEKGKTLDQIGFTQRRTGVVQLHWGTRLTIHARGRKRRPVIGCKLVHERYTLQSAQLCNSYEYWAMFVVFTNRFSVHFRHMKASAFITLKPLAMRGFIILIIMTWSWRLFAYHLWLNCNQNSFIPYS